MNLNDLLEVLKSAPSDAALVFSFDGVDIGRGYHVTEFKLSQTTGIDCGGRVNQWPEAAIQLLDGRDGEHMLVAKFQGILQHSIERVSGLGDAEARIEFSPNNIGLRNYELHPPEIVGDTVLVNLFEQSAVCKPAQESGGGCCEPAASAASTGCCGSAVPAKSEQKLGSCCG